MKRKQEINRQTYDFNTDALNERFHVDASKIVVSWFNEPVFSDLHKQCVAVRGTSLRQATGLNTDALSCLCPSRSISLSLSLSRIWSSDIASAAFASTQDAVAVFAAALPARGPFGPEPCGTMRRSKVLTVFQWGTEANACGATWYLLFNWGAGNPLWGASEAMPPKGCAQKGASKGGRNTQRSL